MIYLSLGENCMPDDVLKRYGIKSFSTPFSSARSNIAYALQLAKNNYNNLLNPDYIKKNTSSPFPNLYRNEHFEQINTSIFEPTVRSGFEFTHHDILHNTDHKESYERKIQRMIDIKDTSENILFFYHHRYIVNEDINEIINLCNEYCMLYKSNVYIVLMIQHLVHTDYERHIYCKQYNNIIICIFYTKVIWGGIIRKYFGLVVMRISCKK